MRRIWELGRLFMLGLVMAAIFVADASAQKVQAVVKIELKTLSLEKQQKLENLASDIETYINDFDWTGDASDVVIPLTIQMFLTDQSVSYESRYGGNFYITNSLDIKYFDKYWRFPYQDGDRLLHLDGRFDPFTGFIDFYIFLILGGEYDKLERFGGNRFFEKASLLNEQAKFNTLYAYGWDQRSKIIERILSRDYEPYRIMKDYYFLGLSYAGDQDTTAQRYCHEALRIMDRILAQNEDDPEIRGFLEAHNLEIVELFKGNEEVLSLLIRMDPDREKNYLEYMKR